MGLSGDSGRCPRIISPMPEQVTFVSRLQHRWQQSDSLICVGLDPDPARIPPSLGSEPQAVVSFCRQVIDATAPYVCAFKPQAAYFGALGLEDELAALVSYVHERHPDIPVILDAKRGDIGATARLYAVEAFERYGADAVTVNAYMGYESLAPYLEYADKGIFVLCRTSNAGSGWLQSFPDDDPTYLRVAREVVSWNAAGNVMLVAGATYPEELGRIRGVVGDMPLLVPGIGAQGGDLVQVLNNGADAAGRGLIINAARSVLFAGSGDDFAAASCAAARDLRDQVRSLQRTDRAPAKN